MKRKKPIKQIIELVSFKAKVVEVKEYQTLGESSLYHAVLDSLPNEPQQQAQFFGLSKDMFSVGDIHVVTFSRPIVRGSKTAKIKEVAFSVEDASLPN